MKNSRSTVEGFRDIGLILLALLVVGCTTNPLATAQTTEQRAYAVLGLYQIVVEEAAVAVRDTAIPVNTRRSIQAAVAAAKPVRKELTAAYLEVVAIKGALAAGETSEARVLVVAQNLERWVLRLEPIVRQLAASLGDR